MSINQLNSGSLGPCCHNFDDEDNQLMFENEYVIKILVDKVNELITVVNQISGSL